MAIRVLAEQVAAQIAAGEVIERPASVVKELVENAIDAGATDIKVEVREGGQRLIKVIDNGCGIPADEVEMAFQRHATSKLFTAEDLDRITTLGFRGEALPSIAAVAQVSLLTRTADEPVGTFIRLEGGRVAHREDRGAPRGTIVTVENLFYNLPARLKFLKTVATEAGHIQDLIASCALAFPERRFTLTSDNRLVFQSLGTGNLFDVLIKVYGLETAKQMLEIGELPVPVSPPPRSPALSVSGYIGAPALHRGSRKDMTFFVNRRWVQDRTLAFATTEAYKTLLPVGRYPVVVLHVEMPPESVDVNVHPAKAEVRFRDSQTVFTAVQRAVRRVLLEHAPIPTMGTRSTFSTWTARDHATLPGANTPGQLGLNLQRTADTGRSNAFEAQAPEPAGSSTKLPILRVVGQVGQAYIIAEGPEGLYLIDQHAAHERVLYEQFQAARAEARVPGQALLEAIIAELTLSQWATLQEQLPLLTELGFQIEPFGGQSVLVRAVPAMLRSHDVARTLAAILDEAAAGDTPLAQEREAKLIASVCKQAAVKAGQTLSPAEMQELIRGLEASSAPRTCPHGRPTMILLSTAQLEREFGRR